MPIRRTLRLIGRFLLASRDRLRELAVKIGVHHLADKLTIVTFILASSRKRAVNRLKVRTLLCMSFAVFGSTSYRGLFLNLNDHRYFGRCLTRVAAGPVEYSPDS